MQRQSVKTVSGGDMKNPGLIRFIFNDPRMAPIWAIIRVLVGLQWLSIAWPKLTDPAWVDGGAIVKGFWENQVVVSETGRSAIYYDWYRDFLNFLIENDAHVFFCRVQPVVEVVIGVLFILGAFVGLVGLTAGFLHVNYLLAGSAGQNTILFPAAILLIAAWKIAGYYGLDYFIMRRVSTLWSPDADVNANPAPVGGGD